MKSECYRITHATKFIIYGAATTGAIFYNNLISQGYNVLCFVDQRADEINSYLQTPVFTIKGIGENGIFPEDEDYCVIIAIKNVFEHEDIAGSFSELGYYNLLFKTKELIQGEADEADKALGETYDLLFKNQMIKECVLPKTHTIPYIPFLDNNLLQDDGKEQINVKIPRAFIFSDRKENPTNEWNFISIMGLIPHLDFFGCINGDIDKTESEYMKYCYEAARRSGDILTSQRWRQSVLENRINIYQNMELERQLNPEFFDNSAPEAVLEDTGVYSIHSGKHRMIYQVINGSYFITLRLLRSEYDRWRNKDTALKLYNKLKYYNIRKLTVPIMNPYFYRFPCDNMMYYYNMQYSVVNFIYRYYYSEKRVTDFHGIKVYNSGMQGMVLCPVLDKMGFCVCSDAYKNSEYAEISEILWKLYAVDVVMPGDAEENYDIVVTDHLLPVNDLERTELLIYIDDFEEQKLTNISYASYEVLGSGFCDNIRKKVTTYIMCRKD